MLNVRLCHQVSPQAAQFVFIPITKEETFSCILTSSPTTTWPTFSTSIWRWIIYYCGRSRRRVFILCSIPKLLITLACPPHFSSHTPTGTPPLPTYFCTQEIFFPFLSVLKRCVRVSLPSISHLHFWQFLRPLLTFSHFCLHFLQVPIELHCRECPLLPFLGHTFPLHCEFVSSLKKKRKEKKTKPPPWAAAHWGALRTSDMEVFLGKYKNSKDVTDTSSNLTAVDAVLNLLIILYRTVCKIKIFSRVYFCSRSFLSK